MPDTPIVAALRRRFPRNQFVRHLQAHPSELQRTLPMLLTSIDEYRSLMREVPSSAKDIAQVAREMFGRYGGLFYG